MWSDSNEFTIRFRYPLIEAMAADVMETGEAQRLRDVLLDSSRRIRNRSSPPAVYLITNSREKK